MDNNNNNNMVDAPQYQFNQSMQKSKKSLQIIILLLLLTVLGLGGYIIYDKFIAVEPEKPIPGAVELPNKFGLFSTNLKSAVAKYSDDFTKAYYLNEQFVDSKSVTDGYSLSVNGEGDLYVKFYNQALIDKFGNPKIADNVLSFYVYASGNGGMNTIYIIKDDGTISTSNIEMVVSGQGASITIDNVGEYKNIVSVISGSFGDGQGEAKGPIFIDVNGNIFSPNITE